MPKPGRRARRERTAGAAQSASHVDHRIERAGRDHRRLLDRILETPHLAALVPRLEPELLHRVIQTCGLEDCSELVALATPDQLSAVFDLDLWRARRPGLDEELDANRFGLWLEVLMEAGAAVAAEKIVAMDVATIVGALAQHMRVFDRAAVSSYESLDGQQVRASRSLADGLASEVGPYLIQAKRPDAWDTIVDLLLFLDAEHRDYFHRVMSGCRRLSNSTPELDASHDLLTDDEQDMFDLVVAREERREQHGYVTPAQARAFLESARHFGIEGSTAPNDDPITRAYFRGIDRTPRVDPRTDAASGRLPGSSHPEAAFADSSETFNTLLDVLVDAGIVTHQPRGLLQGASGESSALARIQAHLLFAREADDAAYMNRTEELAYLANTMMAGCSIQARLFTAREASDAAAAVCNLGLENWPARWLPHSPHHTRRSYDLGTTLPDDFLVHHDLGSVFQLGWRVLHHDVCLYAAERLISILNTTTCLDHEIQSGLDTLRTDLSKHCRAGTPWRARNALDVIAILDMPAWAALLALLDECPVIHAALGASLSSKARAVSGSQFDFISENRQIADVREFMQKLPQILRG